MPFEFLRYIQPIHFFRRLKFSGFSVFPIANHLPEDIKQQLVIDTGYISEIAMDYDLSWQAVQKGYDGYTTCYTHFETVGVKDNYRFIRKNFHPVWVLYVLGIRLLSFRNPIREIKGWNGTRGVTREEYANTPIDYKDYENYESSFLKSQPLVSVIIPTLNRYSYLKEVLYDFERQDYKNFEVLVVDQSDDFQETFYKTFDLNITIIRQTEKALWLARNTAIKHAKGALIALSEDDVRIRPNWISEHLKCLEYFGADVSAGVFYPEGQTIPKERSYFSVASQFATGNALLYKRVFEQVGLFDRQFEKQRMGDAEFGMRVYLAGLKSVSNPLASCVDIKAGTGGLREMGSWDAFRPKNLFAPRPIPSVLYYSRKYYGRKASMLMLLKTIPSSIIPYQFKKNKPLLVIGTLLSLLLFPLIIVQVGRAWYLASIKLEEGPMIKTLDQ